MATKNDFLDGLMFWFPNEILPTASPVITILLLLPMAIEVGIEEPEDDALEVKLLKMHAELILARKLL